MQLQQSFTQSLAVKDGEHCNINNWKRISNLVENVTKGEDEQEIERNSTHTNLQPQKQGGENLGNYFIKNICPKTINNRIP